MERWGTEEKSDEVNPEKKNNTCTNFYEDWTVFGLKKGQKYSKELREEGR